MTALAIGLAVLAALGSAVGTHLQHGAVRSIAPDRALRLRDLASLVHSARWLLGLGSLAIGAGLQVLALSLAPLTVVPPIAVLALPVVAVLGTVGARGRPLSRAVAFAVAACTVGTAAFVAVAATSTTATAVPVSAQGQAAQLVVVVMAGLVGLGALARRRVRCVAFATAAGIGYGFVAVLVRGLTQDLAGPLTWPAVAIVATMAVSGWLVQHAHASGASEVVVACVNVANPLLAATVGLTLLGEAERLNPLVLTAMIVAATVSTVGVVRLARDARPATPAPAGSDPRVLGTPPPAR